MYTDENYDSTKKQTLSELRYSSSQYLIVQIIQKKVHFLHLKTNTRHRIRYDHLFVATTHYDNPDRYKVAS